MNNNLILIDENDQQIGDDTVINCHLEDAKRHRAITAFLKNSKGQYLMAKRSLKKPLWPTYWDAAFSTHPRVGETVEACCERRSQEELGIMTKDYTDHLNYEYHIRWNVAFSEWEINHILIATIEDNPDLTQTNPEEVSETTWKSWDEITKWIETDKDMVSPWLIIAVNNINQDPELLKHFIQS